MTTKRIHMNQNMLLADRIVRILVVLGLGFVYFFGVVDGTWWVLLPVVAGILMASSIVGVCLLYNLLGIGKKPGSGRPALKKKEK